SGRESGLVARHECAWPARTGDSVGPPRRCGVVPAEQRRRVRVCGKKALAAEPKKDWLICLIPCVQYVFDDGVIAIGFLFFPASHPLRSRRIWCLSRPL